jgi:hypothetical protein
MSDAFVGLLLNLKYYFSKYFWYGGLSNSLTDCEDPFRRNYLSISNCKSDRPLKNKVIKAT